MIEMRLIKNVVANMIIIGVKSKAQNLHGIYFLTKEYRGSSIFLIN